MRNGYRKGVRYGRAGKRRVLIVGKERMVYLVSGLNHSRGVSMPENEQPS